MQHLTTTQSHTTNTKPQDQSAGLLSPWLRRYAPSGRFKNVKQVLADVRTLRDEIQPEDYERPLSQALLSWGMPGEYASPSLALIDPDHGFGPRMPLTSTAFAQLCNRAFPRGATSFLGDLAGQSARYAHQESGPIPYSAERMSQAAHSAALAAALVYLARQDQPSLIRTIRLASGRRIVRAVTSQSYEVFDAVDLLRALAGSPLGHLPVLGASVHADSVRVRIALEDPRGFDLARPLPMVEATTSEVGRGAVTLSGGFLRLICRNGMTSWQRGAHWSWRHSGSKRRIARGIGQAVESCRASAQGAVRAYYDASRVVVDNLQHLLQATLGTAAAGVYRLPGAVLDRARDYGMSHSTTPQGQRLLTATEALTLVAQEQPDPIAQRQVERSAWHLMRRGSSVAQRNGGRLYVDAPRTSDAGKRRPASVRGW